MFVLKILRDGGRVKRLKAKKGCSEANGKGSVPASRTARFWRCWTWLFFIFPIDAATVHSEAQETPLWLGASRIEGNPWAPKNPPVDVKLVRWIKRQNVVFCSAFFLVKICGFSLFESTPKLSQFARWWLTALVWSSKEGRFDCWRDLHHGPWWPLHAIAMIVLYPENQPLFLKAKSSTHPENRPDTVDGQGFCHASQFR